ncbi:unnamed protein product, partial [Rotaria magnacalcarata]
KQITLAFLFNFAASFAAAKPNYILLFLPPEPPPTTTRS